jgi:hypothetical protein
MLQDGIQILLAVVSVCCSEKAELTEAQIGKPFWGWGRKCLIWNNQTSGEFNSILQN